MLSTDTFIIRSRGWWRGHAQAEGRVAAIRGWGLGNPTASVVSASCHVTDGVMSGLEPAAPPPPTAKCRLDENLCLSLSAILESFNAPISEEQAWALCYQTAKAYKNVSRNLEELRVVSQLSQVLIHRDGHVHPHTVLRPSVSSPQSSQDSSKELVPTEQNIAKCLGLILFRALDFGFDKDEERPLSPELTNLILRITRKGEGGGGGHGETDDEGIERDSGDCDDEPSNPPSSLSLVMQECVVQVGGSQEADSHYRAVCRALVAEALELSSFLERVSDGTQELTSQLTNTSADLESLNFADWARLWVQVIRELRRGVQLKKVPYTRKPIEYELTPYEILMEDIRARRYKLNKVSEQDMRISQNVKKDAHALILEYIRSRPPLRKASDRKLPPKRSLALTPREMLLESIKKGHVKLRSPKDEGSLTKPLDKDRSKGSTRRLIKIDYSFIPDDEEEDEGEEVEAKSPPAGPWQRTGSKLSNQSDIHQFCDSALQSYDLATQCPVNGRRHTVVACEMSRGGSLSVPPSRAASRPGSRPDSRQAFTPTGQDTLSATLPEMTWSRSSLQEDLFQSKQWQEECLSLTLEEIVHIRSVLTKAELESLPVEGHVKEDAEKRKVCFLCMKTRFGIFGPWGQVCKLCKRTVCAKCYSKMRIPTEHFSHVPVVALSPSMVSPSEPDDPSSFPRALVNRLMETRSGSAPPSPKSNRSAPPSQMSTSLISEDNHPLSLPPPTPPLSNYSDKWRIARDKTLGRHKDKAEKLRGLQMTVCHDCKTMVLQIIKSSRATRTNTIRNLTLDLSPVY